MKLTTLAALTLLTACQAVTPEAPQSALRAPETPEAPLDPSCSPNCPSDLYDAYTAFESRTLQGAVVSVSLGTRGLNAAWSLDGMSIHWDSFDRGRVELSTDRGVESYYFRTYTPSEPFSTLQGLSVSQGGTFAMTLSPITWLDDTTAQVTVCHVVNSVTQRCNTITQAY